MKMTYLTKATTGMKANKVSVKVTETTVKGRKTTTENIVRVTETVNTHQEIEDQGAEWLGRECNVPRPTSLCLVWKSLIITVFVGCRESPIDLEANIELVFKSFRSPIVEDATLSEVFPQLLSFCSGYLQVHLMFFFKLRLHTYIRPLDESAT